MENKHTDTEMCTKYVHEVMEEDYPDDWYNEDDNGESNADRYMEELDEVLRQLKL